MGMEHIRQATARDASRIAEIIVFNYRLNFYPIFRDDAFYFDELQVSNLAGSFMDEAVLECTFVYDDGAVKGVVVVHDNEIEKLFVEPVLHGQGIGARLLDFVVKHHGASYLWALEKNERAIRFYQRHGFQLTGERKLEEDTTEYLVRMER